jgi:predicted ABC-type transport system involved in lysophospholipase L1 biosynthesis ATPase subunit
MAVLLQANNLHKSYRLGKKWLHVLKGASFKVCAGESLAIVGLSGAGKSTLLHVVGGLDRPDHGGVTFLGRDMYSLSSGQLAAMRARYIGFVFQSYHLLPELDVLENTILPAMTGASPVRNPQQMRQRGRNLLDSVGLAARSDHKPMELSGGEQQRLALARALMNDPQIVLADEPTGNLDSATGKQVLDYVFGVVRERQHTLVLVTHNEKLAERCDRTVKLAAGKIRS